MNHYHSLNKTLALLALVALWIAPAGTAGNLPLPTPEATSSITARDLKKHSVYSLRMSSAAGTL